MRDELKSVRDELNRLRSHIKTALEPWMRQMGEQLAQVADQVLGQADCDEGQDTEATRML